VVLSRGIQGNDEFDPMTYAGSATGDISSETLDDYDSAIQKVNNTRAALSASISRQDYVADNL